MDDYTVKRLALVFSKQAEELRQLAYMLNEQLSEEDVREPIQNALYATNKFLTDECTELADGILNYLKDAGFKIVKQ